MAEDLPSSCVCFLGGGVERKNLPLVIVDLRRQPVSEIEPEEEERNKWDVEQRELQAAVAKNAAHWPMLVTAWTRLVVLPTTPIPGKGASAVGHTQGSPALEALASAAAQVERQSATTVPKGAGQVLGQSAGGKGGGVAKPAGGVQLIAKRPAGLIAPPLPECRCDGDHAAG